MSNPGITFLIAFLLSALLVPPVRLLARRLGRVAAPRPDRWHQQPTPYLGGVAIFIAFLIATLITGETGSLWGILVGAGITFVVGLIDDFVNLSPQSKLLGQFLAASVIVFSGTVTYFFPWQLANFALSFLWLVGIANALNLLDNMDGLAGGIALIVAGFLAYFFWRGGDAGLLTLSLALMGGTLGFFIYNFPPASIFMGDGGSLFLGMTLAALAIAQTRAPQASNVFAVIGVPTLIFLLPILDTAMVSLTRLLRGQSPAQGGRDHTSHRLVALGLSERQTVLVLMGVALLSGVSAVVLEALSYTLSLLLIPLVILGFTLFSAYLGQLKVVEAEPAERAHRNLLTNWMVELTYRRRVLEVLLDFFIIAIAYYMAFVTRLGASLSSQAMNHFLSTLPLTVGATFVAFFVLGVYRGVWRFVSLEDAFRILGADVVGTLLSFGVVHWIFGPRRYSGGVFFVYFLLLYFLMMASRFSFRLLDRVARPLQDETYVPVLIYGAGAGGELALRECRQNPALRYRPVGFIDDDPLKQGRMIHGLPVLGGWQELERLIVKHQVQGVLVTSLAIARSETIEQVLEICRQQHVWVRRMRFEFEEMG